MLKRRRSARGDLMGRGRPGVRYILACGAEIAKPRVFIPQNLDSDSGQKKAGEAPLPDLHELRNGR